MNSENGNSGVDLSTVNVNSHSVLKMITSLSFGSFIVQYVKYNVQSLTLSVCNKT